MCVIFSFLSLSLSPSQLFAYFPFRRDSRAAVAQSPSCSISRSVVAFLVPSARRNQAFQFHTSAASLFSLQICHCLLLTARCSLPKTMVAINNPNTTERLIQEVRARPPLWDQRNLNYHNRIVVNALWQDIADSLKVNKETVKVKWKGLRDTYRRELKKQRSLALTNGGIDNGKDPSWTHYSSMNFLREYMGSNNNHSDILQFPGWTTDDAINEEISPTEEAFNSFVSSANIMEVIINSKENIESAESSITDDETEPSENVKAEPRSPMPTVGDDNKLPALPPVSPPASVSTEEGGRKTPKVPPKKMPFASKVNKKPDKEHRFRSKLRKKGNKALYNGVSASVAVAARSSNGIQDEFDDDLYFFKSLIPYVKALPATRKLCLRSEIHNLVLREIMTECSSNQTVIPLEHVSVGLNA